MNKQIAFHEHGWDDYLYWETQDKKTQRRVNQLIEDIERNGNDGIGKPEMLHGEWNGFWSRRIDDTNRLIYRLRDGQLEIAQCRHHYDDK